MKIKSNTFLKIFIIITIFFSCILFCTGGALAMPDQLEVSGTHLIDMTTSQQIRLKGVDVDGLEWSDTGEGPPGGDGGDMTQTLTVAVNTWDCNFVRIPLNQDYWFGYSTGGDNSSSTQNLTFQANYRNYVAKVVNAALGLNLYVELDLHWSGNGTWGSSTNVKQQSMPDENSILFWQSLADTFGNTPNVLFDLYNEPYPNSWTLWKNGGTSNEGFTCPGMQQLVQAVRDHGAKNVLIAGGITWAKDLRELPTYALTDTNTGNTLTGYGIMYEEHNYNNITNNDTAATWEQYIGIAVKNGYCVTIGEFGPAASSGSDPGIVNSGCNPWESNFLAWINGANNENYQFNATAWDLHPTSFPPLITNWNFDPTSCHGIDIKNWLTGYEPPPTPTPIIPTRGVDIFPNPLNFNTHLMDLALKINLKKPEDVIWVRVYSFGMRKIAENFEYTVNNNTGWQTIQLVNTRNCLANLNLANGLYYYVVCDSENGVITPISTVDAFIVLR